MREEFLLFVKCVTLLPLPRSYLVQFTGRKVHSQTGGGMEVGGKFVSGSKDELILDFDSVLVSF